MKSIKEAKAILASSKEEFDIVIYLAIDVKIIERRLETLELQQMLCCDDEYLSSVYKALPNSEKLEWLKFDKSGHEHEWKAMMAFLDEAREKATNSKVLLSCYGGLSDEKSITCRKCGLTGHKKSGCPTKINSARSSKVYTDSSDEEAERNKKEREKELRKKVKEKCGKCPICKERHTFTRNRDGKEWPSDRFISCAKFQKMTPKDRALQLEKSSGCSRCTAWTHKKDLGFWY